MTCLLKRQVLFTEMDFLLLYTRMVLPSTTCCPTRSVQQERKDHLGYLWRRGSSPGEASWGEGSRRSWTSPAVAARGGGPGGRRQQLPMDAGSRDSVRRPPCRHCGDHHQHAPLPTSQPRRLGLHHPSQDDAWRRSPSRGLLAPALGSLSVARPAAGTSSTMAARRRRSWRCPLVCGCARSPGGGDAEEGHRRSVPAGSGRSLAG
jgi:hypothetical protein